MTLFRTRLARRLAALAKIQPSLFFLIVFLLPNFVIPDRPAHKRQSELRVFMPMVITASLNDNDWVTIPGGNFWMGCDATYSGVTCAGDAVPLHRVYLSNFDIDIYEVTNARYARCVRAGACTPPVFNYSRTRASYYDNPQYAHYPVIYVDYGQAETFCAWEGKELPSEAQWEKAARGAGNTNPYPWGHSQPSSNLLNAGFLVGDTTPVNAYAAGVSPYGLYNMAGNVWEWVTDWYDPEYYKLSPVKNPAGPKDGTHKVLRGGSWFHDLYMARVDFRFEFEPGRVTSFGVGFRCAHSR